MVAAEGLPPAHRELSKMMISNERYEAFESCQLLRFTGSIKRQLQVDEGYDVYRPSIDKLVAIERRMIVTNVTRARLVRPSIFYIPAAYIMRPYIVLARYASDVPVVSGKTSTKRNKTGTYADSV